MKKIFLFAAAAALLTACSSEELGSEYAQQKASETPINFSVYTPRTTRAGANMSEYTDYKKGIVTDDLKKIGFGILAYYTDDETYDADKSTPNFMYNTKVTNDGTAWKYNPVMYWPNEFKAATAENIDRVSFFAYAPYVEVDNTTGIPYAKQAAWKTDKTLVTTGEKNIIAISKNTANGDPVVKYVVDTDPKTSVDLLWGVAADNGDKRYQAIDNGNSKVTVTPGLPFLNLVKPNEPTAADGGILNFNMCHALSKLNIDVKYIADAETPSGSSATINADESRIFIRSISIGGFVMKAALDLNSNDRYLVDDTTDPKQYRGKALWKDIDGKSALSWSGNTKFFDGRKDGKEGTESGENPNESYLGLNPLLLENYVAGDYDYKTPAWPAGKNSGVTNVAQNLFGDGTAAADAPIYVIPVGDDIDITIEYDVLTADKNLNDFLSDGLTHGSMIKNIITKKSDEIFGSTTKMIDGKGYIIHLILGMTSVTSCSVRNRVRQTFFQSRRNS